MEIDCINENIVFVAASHSTNGLFGGSRYGDSVFVSRDGANTWEEIQTPEDFGGEGMSWVSPEEGYLMGTEQPVTGLQPKILYYTNDAGKNWNIIAKSDPLTEKNTDEHNALPLVGYPDGIKFFKNGTGYIGSMRGTLLKTTDKGKTYNPVTFTTETDVIPVPCFVSEDEGHAISADTKLVHTIDGGNTWEEVWPK